MLKVNIITLGCSKNLVDSEQLAGLLGKDYKVCFDSEKGGFDIVIINTCGFIKDAKEESIDEVLRYAEKRKKGKIKLLIVFGCLVQRYKDELAKEIPEVDEFFGANDFKSIAEYILKKNLSDNLTERKTSTPSHYAYLKISEGCDKFCSFCAIPYIRGRHVSEPMEKIISQAEALAKQGVKELIVVAQDTINYGSDLYKKHCITDLLRELAKIEGIEWIRLQYSYPNDFPEDLLDLMSNEPKICKYIDMPLQHIDNAILSSMNRHITSEEIYSLIEKIRAKVPDICLRTTLIVGYPNESEQQFKALEDFVSRVKFDRMGAFTYSPEEGTAAYQLSDNVSEETKEERLDRLTQIQQNISFSLNQAKVGKVFKVLIDRKEGDLFVGRTEFDSPEVDNEVLISAEQKAEVGKFVFAKITAAEEFDLYADIV
ncbi:MAG: 30S ribosomal protein S12 methylthiotransferase RimO [Candidatus Onthomorpha sp.]